MQKIAEQLRIELGVNVMVAGVEAVMASLGALTTPGTSLPLAILDMGGGSTDAAVISEDGKVSMTHQAGAGELVSMLIETELGLGDRHMAEQIVPILSLGGKGVISVLSNVAPRETHDICASFFAGDIAGSRALQLKALPLIEALFCEVNPIPVKKAVNLMGMEVGGLRMPLTELSEAHTVQLKKAMQEFGIQLA